MHCTRLSRDFRVSIVPFVVSSSRRWIKSCSAASPPFPSYSSVPPCVPVPPRIGGLRCPIDLCGLRWSEIDWDSKWFWVHSPKTEHHVGKGKRQVPLFPELERCFQEFYNTLPEGCDDLVFPEKSNIAPIISPKKSLSSWIKKVATRAGVELWEKSFQNCRSSRDTELRKIFPEYLVNRWIRHPKFGQCWPANLL